jgi:hypothetical protein
MSEAKRQGKTKATTGGISSASEAKTMDAPVTEATSKFCWNWAVIFDTHLRDNPNFPFKPGDKVHSKLVKTDGSYSIVLTKADAK